MLLFSKGKYLVIDEFGKKLISGVRTLGNCYGLVPDTDIVCNSIRLPNEDLWHHWMGRSEEQSLNSSHGGISRMPSSA